MGEAKNRGTYEQRKELAIKSGKPRHPRKKKMPGYEQRNLAAAFMSEFGMFNFKRKA